MGDTAIGAPRSATSLAGSSTVSTDSDEAFQHLILVVDDNEPNRYVTVRTLQGAGFAVVSAGTGEDALLIARAERPQLAILDIKLPDMSGYELCRRIKSEHPATAILHLTAHQTSPRAQAYGLEGGADGYLIHPVDPIVLLATARALLRMRDTEEKYRLLFDLSPDPIWVHSEQNGGRLLAVNGAAARLFGYSAEDLLQMPLAKLFDPENFSDVSALRLEATWPMHTQGGETVHVRLVSAPTIFEGRAARLVSATDVTGMVQIEQQLQEAISARDDFMSIASHELKTPLTALSLQLQLMLRGLPVAASESATATSSAPRDAGATSGDPLRRLAQRSFQQSSRLTKLVDELLDFTRIRAGKLSLERETVELAGLLRELSERQLESALLTVKAPDRYEGEWDRMRLEQVFVNLISNAIKYGNGKPVQIELIADQAMPGAPADSTARGVLIEVHDSGLGISPAEQPRIFERFERAVNDRGITGLGLGLYIAKQIVTAHGGTISVQSELGHGSTFRIWLPTPTKPAAGDRL